MIYSVKNLDSQLFHITLSNKYYYGLKLQYFLQLTKSLKIFQHRPDSVIVIQLTRRIFEFNTSFFFFLNPWNYYLLSKSILIEVTLKK